MKIELHILQNFAPSCLNRDDTNSPKECEVGGVRRARISSQSLKRSQRVTMQTTIPATDHSVRTKRLAAAIAEKLVAPGGSGATPEEALVAATLAIEAAGLKLKLSNDGSEQLSEYLLFIPARTAEMVTKKIVEHWPAVKEVVTSVLEAQAAVTPPSESIAKAKEIKKAKAPKKKDSALPDDLVAALKTLVFDATRAPEVALFGRMLAGVANENVDAACQVAHGFSTNRVSMEFDFYTAVDDLKPKENSGADMMGTAQFNSACFYRYSVVDMESLARNLTGRAEAHALTAEDNEDAAKVAEAYLHAAIHAIPSARQNGSAAHNRPSLVVAVVRETGAPQSLANAFVKPVRAAEMDLEVASMRAFDMRLAQELKAYGSEGICSIRWFAVDPGALSAHADGVLAHNDKHEFIHAMDGAKELISKTISDLA